LASGLEAVYGTAKMGMLSKHVAYQTPEEEEEEEKEAAANRGVGWVEWAQTLVPER
jgi:hypothetical protein